MLAGRAMTQVSLKPFSRSKLTMWAGKAAVTAIIKMTKTPIKIKGAFQKKLESAQSHQCRASPPGRDQPSGQRQKTVLARPPKNVIVMMARRKFLGNRRVTSAKAGEYRTVAIAAPKPAQTA